MSKPRELKNYTACPQCGLFLSQNKGSRARHLVNCEKLPPLPQLVAEYETDGMTYRLLAEKYGVSNSFIREQILEFRGYDARAKKNQAKRVNYALKGGGCAKCGIVFNKHDGAKPSGRVKDGQLCDVCIEPTADTRPKTYYSSPREARTLI